MKQIIPIFFITTLGCLFTSCISQNGPDILTIDRAKRLLALDTGKIWLRVSSTINKEDVQLDECQLANFYSIDILDQSDTVFYIGSEPGCQEITTDTLNRWSLLVVGNVKEQFQDSLMLTDEEGNVTFRFIRELSSTNLEWEFQSGENVVREEFVWQF